MYAVIFSKNAEKHKQLLKQAHLDSKARSIIEVVRHNPFQNPPPYEKLLGEFQGAYSRRLNHQHRFVYTADEKLKAIHVVSMWTHYE